MPDDHDLDDADAAELRALVERTRPGDVVWDTPPEALWDKIADAIEHEQSVDAPVLPADRHRDVVPMTGRRRSRWPVFAIAAAAVIVAVAAAVVAVGRDDDDREVVSAVELERLGAAGSGRAELVDRDGTLQVRLETDGLDAGDGYLELWLLDPTATRLVSLGPLRADGIYDVPAGVDPGEFPVVDVSIEPVDGDPTHSGQSVLRGQLPL